MITQAITLMEAYIIENLRRHGVSNDELVHIDEQAIEHWKTLDERFDFTILQKLAEQNGHSFSSIIHNGYRVKFLTLNGLVNLVELKLNQIKDEDFVVHKDGIRQLQVNQDELEQVQQMLSPNWKIEKEESGLAIRSVN